MSSDIAIKVDKLSKCYHIYDKPHDRLMQMLHRGRKQYYHEFWALKDVSFEIKKGETVGIIGRNGSGKSTLLQMICGTLNPTSGNIQANGRIAALLELGSGFNPEFTGRENVYLNGAVLGLNRGEVEARFDDIAAFADIGNFIEQPVKTYSSGMLVRLAFAVAINVDPQILVVDEALSVGDELFQRKCFSRIEKIKSNGATILFVSHSATMINQLCDEAILIDYGSLLLRNQPQVVTKQYHRLIFSNSVNENNVLESIKKAGEVKDNNSTLINERAECYSDYLESLFVQKPLKYQNQGGEIISFELQDDNYSKVNIIASGFVGYVRLVVRFDQEFNDVTFGFHLKSIRGVEISGLSHPSPQDALIQVGPNETMEVIWRVNMSLVPGTYFFTYGVRSMGSDGFIDRVVDGSLVKVIEKEGSSAYGLFDISINNQSWARKIIKV